MFIPKFHNIRSESSHKNLGPTYVQAGLNEDTKWLLAYDTQTTFPLIETSYEIPKQTKE
jgi:hypothetical protein